MTDKQIMIDGVNVLNCGHYSQFEGKTENACYIMQKTFIREEEISKEYCSCETNPNCYYKQLKRKEQECEELVSKGNQLDKKCKQQSWDIGNLGYKIKNQRHEINNRLKQLDQLKMENEELREKCKKYGEINEQETKDYAELKAENAELKYKAEFYENYNNAHIDKITKLEKTLAEIKKVCNSVENIENVNSLYDAKLSGMYLQAKQILQKIRECEVE
ncbi:MAG: hypothetical protein II304_02630 [Bacteroidales bacterium]|nr:hypothetical protein [Bacteroidales bacterium]